MGPRQTTAWPSFIMRPMDIMVTPKFLSGRMVLPSGLAGRPETPSIRGCDGP